MYLPASKGLTIKFNASERANTASIRQKLVTKMIFADLCSMFIADMENMAGAIKKLLVRFTKR